MFVVCCLQSEEILNKIKNYVNVKKIRWEENIRNLDQLEDKLIYTDYDIAVIDQEICWHEGAMNEFKKKKIDVIIFTGNLEEIGLLLEVKIKEFYKRIKIVEKPIVIEKHIEREVEVVSNSTVAVISGCSTGKSFISWNLAHCFANRDYETSVINLDTGYSANILYGIDKEEESALYNIGKLKDISELIDKAYRVNKNLRVLTNKLCSDEEITNNQFMDILNIVQADSDITIIDCKSELNEVVKTAVTYSNTVLFIFDIDNMHYNLNLNFLESLKELNPRKTIIVINNIFQESNEVENTKKLITDMKKEFKDIIFIKNAGAATYDCMLTSNSPYFETDDEEFKNNIDNLMNSMKAREKKKSFFERFFK